MKAQEALIKYSKLAPSVTKLVAKIKADEPTMAVVKEAGGKYDITTLMKMLPFLSTCDEVYEMVAIYNDKTTEDIKNEEFADFINQIKAMMLDGNFSSFIKPQA
jgi:hypothetical protein